MKIFNLIDEIKVKITGRPYIIGTDHKSYVTIFFKENERYTLYGWFSGVIFCTKINDIIVDSAVPTRSPDEVIEVINKDVDIRIKVKLVK